MVFIIEIELKNIHLNLKWTKAKKGMNTCNKS